MAPIPSFRINLVVTAVVTVAFVIVGGQKDIRVNILFIYQDDEGLNLFNKSLKFFDKHRNYGVQIGTVHYFNASYTDAKKLLTDFCMKLDVILKEPDIPDVAIDFTRINVPSEGVKLILKVIQMPTISATFGQVGDVREWRELDSNQKGYLIQVSPPADLLVQSVRSFVDMQNMTSAVVLFDDKQYEMYHKYKSLLQNMPTRHLLSKTLSGNELSEQIYKLVHVDIVNFFIAGNVDQIIEVLNRASKPKQDDGPYFSDEYAWYSMTLLVSDTKVPHCSQCEMDVTLVHLSPMADSFTETKRRGFLSEELNTPELTLTQMFYLDMTLDAILAVVELKKTGKWIHNISNNTCFEYGKEYVKANLRSFPSIKLPLKAAFSKAGMENSLGPFRLDENGKSYPNFKMKINKYTFKAKTGTPQMNEYVGTWAAGLERDKLLITYFDGNNLESYKALTVFRIVTVIQSPFVMKLDNCTNEGKGNKYNNCFEGYCIELLEKIQRELKFNYTIRNVSGYGYMDEEEPHQWNGMVRELETRKADIALGAMSVMAERESIVDFTVPYYDLVGISILMKKPKTETSLFKFLTVLENDVWMCILGAYFFTSLLMWIFDRWSPYSYQNNREKYEDDEEKREFNFKECLWFCMTSLTPQGGGEAPKNLSGRLVAATWWLFGFIIIASYTANLAAFLTVSRLDSPVESLEDLSKQYKVQYAPTPGSSAWIYFHRMAHIEHRFYELWKDMSLNDTMKNFERSQLAVWDYPVSDKYTKMWQAMKENEPPKTFDLAVERVRGPKVKNDSKEQDGFAFLDEATNIKWQTTICCDFDQKGEEFSRKPYAIAVQKGSPLKESFSHMILKLLNQRYLEQLKEKWWTLNPKKVDCPKDENQSDGISIHNIGGVFIVIFVGIVMACCTLIFEYWWYRKRNVSEELAEMELPPPKEFGTTFTTTPPSVEKTNFNTQYDKPPERTTLPSIENSW